MLQKPRVGLIVWGAILLIISFIFIAMGAQQTALLAGFAIFFIGGAIMLVFGIINVVHVSSHNNTVLSGNTTYTGTCPSCSTPIKCSIRDFKPHGRYPEGFLYCPVCKKPISKNAFSEVPYTRQ